MPRSSHKVSVILVRVYRNLYFLDTVKKNNQTSIIMNIVPMGAELFYVDEQTDMTKPIGAFRNFAKTS